MRFLFQVLRAYYTVWRLRRTAAKLQKAVRRLNGALTK